MSLFVVGPFIPIGSRDDIGFSITIQIAQRGSFASEFIGQLGLFETVDGMICRRSESVGSQKSEQEHREGFDIYHNVIRLNGINLLYAG